MAKVYQLKVSLRGVKPPVWRRILVEDTMTFMQLQKTVDIAFGWPLSKFSAFKVRGITVCQRHSHIDVLKECLNSITTRLFVFNLEPGDRIEMKQDIVDKWTFDVKVEAYMAPDMKNAYPICVDAMGITPPKELGSPREYAQLLQALSDENHESHAFYKFEYSNFEKENTLTIKKINHRMIAL